MQLNIIYGFPIDKNEFNLTLMLFVYLFICVIYIVEQKYIFTK